MSQLLGRSLQQRALGSTDRGGRVGESSFGPNAGADGDESSYQADIDAAYDDGDDDESTGLTLSDSDANEAGTSSHAADIAAGYDDDDTRRDS
jgi:hypothetical protein